ncbi:hypothetical protein B0T20DRAFT_499685 [Sordaria brevicollis]|uniref:Uncharacterized protein n=1 Tax=Sordaria brevicollis TaxID=83679 RepID=A0AAE0PDC9_SORBR|nr:hypothetical protein B0T20DRAFT_499685 [Sordaria brevicollis]
MSQDPPEAPPPRATTPADEYHWYLLYQLIRGLEWLRLQVQSNDPDAPVQQKVSAETRKHLLETLNHEIEEVNTTDNLLYSENMKYEDRVKNFPQDESSHSHDIRLGKFRQQSGYEERLDRFRREWTEEAALERIAELFGVWSDVRKQLGLNEEEKDMEAVREHMRKMVVKAQMKGIKSMLSLWPKVPEKKIIEKGPPK